MKYVEIGLLVATIIGSFAILGLSVHIWMGVIKEWKQRRRDADV